MTAGGDARQQNGSGGDVQAGPGFVASGLVQAGEQRLDGAVEQFRGEHQADAADQQTPLRRLQASTKPAATTRAAKKKWIAKLEWPRIPNFMPRRATWNLPRHDKRGRDVLLGRRRDERR